MKKFIRILLIMALVFNVASCGPSSDNIEGTTKKEETTKKQEEAKEETKKEETTEKAMEDGVVLKVSIWDENQRPGLEEIMADFTEKTGIKTEVQVIGWNEYWTLLASGASGGELPDVFWMHSNESQKYMQNDLLLDMTDYIANSEIIDLENYPKDIIALYMDSDKNYAIPKDIDTIAIWYNKTMFDEAGVEYPEKGWTFDDLVEKAKALTKDDGSQYGIAINVTNNQAGYYNFIYANGGYVISDDKKSSGWADEKTLGGMNVIARLLADGSMPPLETMAENAEDVLFTSGKIAMAPMGSWMLAAMKSNDFVKENCDIVSMPTSNEGGEATIYNGLGWAISANTPNKDAAWQLVEYLGSKEAQTKQAELGVTMSAYKGTSDAWVSSTDAFDLSGYLYMLNDVEKQVIRPYSRNTIAWENMSHEELKNVWLGETSMEDACKVISDKMNEILAEE